MSLRLKLHDEMQPHVSKFIVAGKADKVWETICRQHPRLYRNEGDDELPSCLRPFVDMRETDWRGHRLFGIEPPFGNNGEDLRGQDCVISIAAERCSTQNRSMNTGCPSGARATGWQKACLAKACWSAIALFSAAHAKSAPGCDTIFLTDPELRRGASWR